MTALVIVIYNMGGVFDYGGDGSGVVLIDGMPYEGAGITSKAFANYIPYSNVFLTIAVVLFAVSTMISCLTMVSNLGNFYSEEVR